MPSTIRTPVSAAWLILALAAAALAGCSDTPNQAAAPPPPAVTVANPVKRSITDQDEYVGRFVAVDSVEVRARLSGYLSQIHFQDGQMVKQGQLLFTVDRRPFQIVLDQARANLELARANLAFAESDLARGQELLRNKTITEQTFEQRTQAKRVADASVAAGPVGRTAAADTDAYMRSEILSYSRARGVFAGISLEGSTLRPDNDANRNLYGRSLTAAQIIKESEVQAPAVANDLIAQLQKTSPKLKAS